MRIKIYTAAVMVSLACFGCGAKETSESATTSPTDNASNATDIAETTAAPIDTATLKLDSLSTERQ